ncbi:MAG: carboxylating.nicotinate-nucleotide diphosphorylase [Candidatus Peregrinibacteria bacterium]|nr:carboxylating.nicotinate-nucleotide diphosphorylase [Candidatus Peregrinibacteria bacterium]MDZ4245028.1 carboxylating.nicotinate-nucleotide diphosphorylase [Candidatus Gracilibacteria bacterium]
MRIEDHYATMQKLYNKTAFFNVGSMVYFEFLTSYIDSCLKADLADNGDVTTTLLHEQFPAKVTAQIIAKQDGVFSGEEELEYIAKKAGLNLKMELITMEHASGSTNSSGARFRSGDVICTLKGSAYSILSVERTLLNLLQRMCGIATAASRFETKYTKVAVTRKTPLPFVDKRAAIDGGALPHRVNLSDAIMIKDTHLDQFGRDFNVVEEKLKNAYLRGISFVEIEVETQDEALKVAEMAKKLDLKVPMVVMLDNFIPENVKNVVKALETDDLWRYVLVEVSGGITSENYKEYDIAGVSVMSIGGITHSVRVCDISMKIF